MVGVVEESSSKKRESSSSVSASIGCLSSMLLIPMLAAFYALYQSPSLSHTFTWSIAQFLPIKHLRNNLQQAAWEYWETSAENRNAFSPEDIPTVDVQKYRHDLLNHLIQTFGKDWRDRPLLLKGLWTAPELQDDQLKLSLNGLLNERLVIPYFTDARIKGALTPNHQGEVREIVKNMTRGKPHKIGSQLVVQTYPDLIAEVAPFDIVTSLFGNYFAPKNVQGTGPMNLLPALTTVPLFVANNGLHEEVPDGDQDNDAVDDNDSETANETEQQPFTALHCEPIANVAVQLSGMKRWLLVRPEYSHQIKPSVSPDGRAFFASWQSSAYTNVPTYSVVTEAGDALWLPTWTWHRVDYIESADMAIGASLFHFRPVDFVRNNPLFALLMIPAMILELVGYNTQ